MVSKKWVSKVREWKKIDFDTFFTMYTTTFGVLFLYFQHEINIFSFFFFFLHIMKLYVNGKTWKFHIEEIYCVNTQSSSWADVLVSMQVNLRHRFTIIQLKVWATNSMRRNDFQVREKILIILYVHSVRIRWHVVGCACIYTTMSSKWERERKKENFHPHITREKLHFAATRSSRSLDTRYIIYCKKI